MLSPDIIREFFGADSPRLDNAELAAAIEVAQTRAKQCSDRESAQKIWLAHLQRLLDLQFKRASQASGEAKS